MVYGQTAHKKPVRALLPANRAHLVRWFESD